MAPIPVVLADHLWLPGDPELRQQAALFVPETEEAVAVLPARLEALAVNAPRLQAMQAAGQQLWQRYGLPGFAVDVRAFLRDPMAVLSARARQQLPDGPLEVAATSSAELPLRVRRSLLNAEPSRSVLIRINDDAPAERLQIRFGTGVPLRGRAGCDLATVMSFEVSSAAAALPPPRLLDRQGWSTLLAGALLLLISFTTSYGDGNLLHFISLKTAHQIGMGLHLAALAALVGDVELASRLRHRARNREIEDRISREREAAEAAAREQRQNRALRAGALFLLDPSTLHRRFLAYIASELAGPP